MSAERPELDCPIADSCGGCALIREPYTEQLRIKHRQVHAAFDVYPTLRDRSVDRCLPAPLRERYRNRAKLAVRERGGRVQVGLYRRGTDDLVDLAPCLVHRPALTRRASAVGRWLERHRLAQPSGPVKHVDLRDAADGRWHLTLVVQAERARDSWPVASLVEAAPGLVGLSVNVNPHASSFVFGPTTRTVAGDRSFTMRIDGPDGRTRGFEVPATGFFQLATGPLSPIHRMMSEHLGGTGPLLDLYCGVGLHGLTLASLDGARGGGELTGIEEHVAAAACARRNADRLGVRARIHAGRVEGFADALSAARRVVVNPGRAGCRPGVLDGLSPGAGRRLAYLSCDPSTLARDLDRLIRRGWRLGRTVPIDLLPQTDHVETLALLATDAAA